MNWLDAILRDAERRMEQAKRQAERQAEQAERQAEQAQRQADRAQRQADRVGRQAERVRNSSVTSGSMTIKQGGGVTMSATADGRRVSTGPGYVVIGDRYWVTGDAYEIRVDGAGTVTADGVELFEGHPVPGGVAGGVYIVLGGGRLSLNGFSIPDYVVPAWAGRTSIRQNVPPSRG